MKVFKILGLLLLALISINGIYIACNKPRFWWNEEWAGVSLHRSGYQSLSLRFCDGQTWDASGKLVPVTIVAGTNGPALEYRKYHFPTVSYVKYRRP